MSIFDFFKPDLTPKTRWGGMTNNSPLDEFIRNEPLHVVDEWLADLLAELVAPDTDKDRSLEAGDVIGVHRLGYDHYGVYAGNDRVIHYTKDDTAASCDGEIMETHFSKFALDSEDFFILNLEYLEPRKYSRLVDAHKKGLMPENVNTGFLNIAIRAWEKSRKKDVFSPEKTIARARSRLGESEYNLVVNNCEHFAIWCKTGISESHQIEDILKGSPQRTVTL